MHGRGEHPVPTCVDPRGLETFVGLGQWSCRELETVADLSHRPAAAPSIDLLPAIGHKTERRQKPFELFVEVEVIMAVDRNIMHHERADNIVRGTAAAVKGDA